MNTTSSLDGLAPFAFTVNVSVDVLDDLRARLKATRFAPDPENEDETYGLSTAVLRPLVEYWQTASTGAQPRGGSTASVSTGWTSAAPRCTSCASAARARRRSRCC